jgi:phosphoribosyl 1,2-cyclic phosphodiesterase
VRLFPHDLRLCPLGSGSSGNATWIGDGRVGVLVDAGVSARAIAGRLTEAGLGDAPIDAVLVTHEHGDHVGFAATLARALARRGRPVPFYMTAGTRDGLPPRCMPDGVEVVEPGRSLRIGHLDVEAFRIPHDTLDPVAWRVGVGDTSVAVVTDLGKPTKTVSAQLRRCAAALLEFNHDEEMLWNGPYPWPLKQRVRGDHGHLSNRQAAELLSEGLSGRLRQVVLGHLSEQNNTERHAEEAARTVVEALGLDVSVRIARPRASSEPLAVPIDD